MQTRRLPVAALVLAAALFGIAVTGVKYALGGFDPITLLAVGLAAATIALWTVVLLRGYRPVGDVWWVALLGLFEPALAYLAENVGLARTSAANGALVSSLESVFVVVLAAIFLRERITPLVTAAVALALLGLAVLEGSSRFAGPGAGDLIVAGGVLSAASYTIVAKRMSVDTDPLSLTACQFAVGTVVVLPIAAASWGTRTEALPAHVPMKFWCAAVLVGILGYAASFLLYNYAIVRVDAAPAGIIVNLIPVFGLLAAVVWLHDTLTAGRVIGALLIGLSVVIFTVVELGGAPSGARVVR